MIDFKNAKAIYIYPGFTDMRYGLNGLYLMAGQPEENTIHIFCGKNRRVIKIIAPLEGCVYLIQKRLTIGHFNWPAKGEISELQVAEIVKILEGDLIVKRIEEGGVIKTKKIA